MIQRMGHVAFVVRDMAQSLAFYRDILGFEQAFTLQDQDGAPWIEYLKLPGGQFLELFYNRTNMQENASYSHLCLEVDDIQAIAAHLRRHHVPLDEEPKQGEDTNWQCWAKDPDGNRIEFMQMMPTSPQANV